MPDAVATSVSSTQLPPWYQESLRNLIGSAQSVANEPYAAYPGQRLAPFSPDQMSAWDLTRAGAGAWQPYFDAAAGDLASARGAYDAALGYLSGAGGDLGAARGYFGNAANVLGQAQGYLGQAGSTYDQARGVLSGGLGDIYGARGDLDYARSLIGGAAGDQALARQGIGEAADYFRTAGGPFNQGEFDQYLSPYTGSVMDEIARRGAQNLTENLLPGVNTTFTGAGQFGSSRHADFTQRAIRDTQESILGQQAQTMAGAYNSAMDAYLQGRGLSATAGQGLLGGAGAATGLAGQTQGLANAATGIGQARAGLGTAQGQIGQGISQIGAGVGNLAQTGAGIGSQYGALGAGSGSLAATQGQLGATAGQVGTQQAGLGTTTASLGTALQGANLKDAAALETIGQTQQGQDQRSLDIGYQDFLAQRGYPQQQATFLNSIIRGLQPGTTTTTQQPIQQPSTVSQIGGAALGSLGLLGMLQNAGFFKKGGRVKRGIGRYAAGGIPRVSDNLSLSRGRSYLDAAAQGRLPATNPGGTTPVPTTPPPSGSITAFNVPVLGGDSASGGAVPVSYLAPDQFQGVAPGLLRTAEDGTVTIAGIGLSPQNLNLTRPGGQKVLPTMWVPGKGHVAMTPGVISDQWIAERSGVHGGNQTMLAEDIGNRLIANSRAPRAMNSQATVSTLWGLMTPEQQAAKAREDAIKLMNRRPGHRTWAKGGKVRGIGRYAAGGVAEPTYDIATGTWTNIPRGLTAEDMNNPHNPVAFNAMLRAYEQAGPTATNVPAPIKAAMDRGEIGTNRVATGSMTSNLGLMTAGSTNFLRDAKGQPVNIAYDRRPTDVLAEQAQNPFDPAQRRVAWENSPAGMAYFDRLIKGDVLNAMNENADLWGRTPDSPGKWASFQPLENPAAFVALLSGRGAQELGAGMPAGLSSILTTNERTGEVVFDPTQLYEWADQLDPNISNTAAVKSPFSYKAENAGSVRSWADYARGLGITGPVTLGFVDQSRLLPEEYWDAKRGTDANVAAMKADWDRYQRGEMTLEEIGAFNDRMGKYLRGEDNLHVAPVKPEGGWTYADRTPTHEVYTTPQSRFTETFLQTGDPVKAREAALAGNVLPTMTRPWLQGALATQGTGGRGVGIGDVEGWKRREDTVDHPLLGKVPLSVARHLDAWIVSQSLSSPSWRNPPWAGDPTAEAYAADVLARHRSNPRGYQATPQTLEAFRNRAPVTTPSAGIGGTPLRLPTDQVYMQSPDAFPQWRAPAGSLYPLGNFRKGGPVKGIGGYITKRAPRVARGIGMRAA